MTEIQDPRPGDRIDLDNCAREPIHIPGAIQPTGALLHLRPRDLRIVQVSENAEDLLGLPAARLEGRTLDELVDGSTADALRARITASLDSRADPNPLAIGIVGDEQRRFDAFVHEHDDAVLLELEPHDPGAQDALVVLYGVVHTSLGRMQAATSVAEVAQHVAQEVRALTGFDRVMVYRFDHDWAGDVIAEAKREDLEAFLGLHYPASDIPAQARRLYALNWIRTIPDINYEPVGLQPPLRPDSGGPLDLSFATLRSVSPIHLEYLGNMGSQATMTISLLDGEKLWGLIACHHTTPIALPYPLRIASEFLGQVVSLHLTTKEDREVADERVRIREVQTRIIERISGGAEFPESLVDRSLLDVVNATGCVVQIGGRTLTIGRVPPPERVDALIRELAADEGAPDVISTHALGAERPGFADIADVASGLLAVTIHRSRGEYVLWFREEVIATVTWGGDPNKPVEVQSGRLSPRGSFAEWEETVRGTSSPWVDAERRAAEELRSAIRTLVLQRAEELAELNEELARSNKELDDFAHIASHDLREPLRGMSNYATYIKEDYEGALDDEGVHKLDTLVRLTQRMEDLIDSLLHYSQVGRTGLEWQELDLGLLARDTVDLYGPRLAAAGITAEVGPLPTVACDPVRLAEVFNNLVSNAIKYREDRSGGHIWIGAEVITPPGGAEPETAIYVRDDGIGIRDRHQEAIFRIFKRLHGRDKYGGGTGSGLTLAQKIVDRHGGRIWVDSTPGEGSTFYFTIGTASS